MLVTGGSSCAPKVLPQMSGLSRLVHERMIHRISKNPAMDPMTMPAMAPPDKLLPPESLPMSVTTVAVSVACRGCSAWVRANGSVRVGVHAGGRLVKGAIVSHLLGFFFFFVSLYLWICATEALGSVAVGSRRT